MPVVGQINLFQEKTQFMCAHSRQSAFLVHLSEWIIQGGTLGYARDGLDLQVFHLFFWK